MKKTVCIDSGGDYIRNAIDSQSIHLTIMKIDAKTIRKHFSIHNIQANAYALNAIERTCSYDDFERSSIFCEKALKAAGFSQVERIAHEADGVTSSFDCVMPQAWDLDKSKRSFLEIVDAELSEAERLIADSTANPLHVTVWSAPTPSGGLTAELVDFSMLKPGHYEAAKGKWVLYAHAAIYTSTAPASLLWGLYHDLTEAGIAGLVTTDMLCADLMPNELNWQNGIGYTGWYLTKGEKKVPTFAITPLATRRLQGMLAKGPVTLHGELHCRNYDGKIHTVTGIIPGESKKEIALLAHLYEPFVNDDAAGFAHLCEFGRQLIERKVKLKRTLRVVFSMELYGMAAYLKSHSQNIILAANFDGIPHAEEPNTVIVRRTPFNRAHFSDWLNLDLLAKRLPLLKLEKEYASYSDDTFTNDPDFGQNGIPTFWLHSHCNKSHHSTGHLFDADWAVAKNLLPVFAEILETLLCTDKLSDFAHRAARELGAASRSILTDKRLDSNEKRLWLQAEFIRQQQRLESVHDFTGQAVSMEPLQTTWRRLSAVMEKLPPKKLTPSEQRALEMVVTRGKLGYPFSLAAVPLKERHPVFIPHVLWALFDGTRNLLECIRMADAERNSQTSSQKLVKIIDELHWLADYGYLTIDAAPKGNVSNTP